MLFLDDRLGAGRAAGTRHDLDAHSGDHVHVASVAGGDLPLDGNRSWGWRDEVKAASESIEVFTAAGRAFSADASPCSRPLNAFNRRRACLEPFDGGRHRFNAIIDLFFGRESAQGKTN